MSVEIEPREHPWNAGMPTDPGPWWVRREGRSAVFAGLYMVPVGFKPYWVKRPGGEPLQGGWLGEPPGWEHTSAEPPP